MALACVGCVIRMFVIVDGNILEYLSTHDCSSDAIINFSFRTMYKYNSNLRAKNWATVSFLIAIISIDLLLLGFTIFLEYLNSGKDKSDEEPLLDKKKTKDESSDEEEKPVKKSARKSIK